MEQRAISAVIGRVKATLAANLRSSLTLCAEALGNDGYVSTPTQNASDADDATASGQGEKEPQGALTMDMIERLTVPKAILQHKVWPTVSEGIECLTRFEQTATSISTAMSSVLSQTKAWTVF